MNVIDAHHHLWELRKLRYPWLEQPGGTAFFGDISGIRRDYTLADYRADCASQQVVKPVHVQAEVDETDPVAETRWLQSIADDPESAGFPHAIVAFADLTRDDVERILEEHAAAPNLRGIRQILNYHPDPGLTYTERDMLLDERWWRNFGLLKKFGLSFDLQLYFPQMERATRLAREHGDILIILNHTGMPAERDDASLAGWRDGMRALSRCDNVAVKISGLGMCDPAWTVESIRPFVLETIELFTTERCMFASNFPVDKLFSDYDRLFEAFKTLTSELSADEQARLFHDNAARYYRL